MNRDWIEVGLRLLAWGCVGLLAVLSLLPAEEVVRTGLGGYVEHMLAYAGTALLMRLGHPGRKAWWIAAGLVIYAGLLECLQYYSPGRTPAIEGWLTSSLGALVGTGIAHRLGGVLRHLRVAGPRR